MIPNNYLNIPSCDLEIEKMIPNDSSKFRRQIFSLRIMSGRLSMILKDFVKNVLLESLLILFLNPEVDILIKKPTMSNCSITKKRWQHII